MDIIEKAAEAIRKADVVLIGAGAGMGVDSGLPDFRGNEGFWKAYPPFKKLGYSFIDMANPQWFQSDPALAWGFYGHRLDLYRKTIPHEGFQVLKRIVDSKQQDYFIFTSNVDGQFQKAGFADEKILECHGSIHYFQEVDTGQGDLWKADEAMIDVEQTTFRAKGSLPVSPSSGLAARPNILMFGDHLWNHRRSDEQYDRFQTWASQKKDATWVVIEVGAGKAVPTVRGFCEQMSRAHGCPLIRINPRDPNGPRQTYSISCGALEALQQIESILVS